MPTCGTITFSNWTGSITVHNDTCTTTSAWMTWTGNDTSDSAWGRWITNSTCTTTGNNYIVQPAAPVNPMRRLRDRLEGVRRRRRARELLRRLLTEEQWQDWELYRSVRQVGASGALYEVIDRYAYELRDGRVARKLCWHGIDAYCLEDRIGAFVLWLRTHEADFLGSTHDNRFTPEEERRVLLRRHEAAKRGAA